MNPSRKNELKSVWDAMKPDIITTRLFFDPLAVPLTVLFSKVGWITANRVTFFALLPGLAGTVLFSRGEMVYGALGYYLFFLLDSIDGKLARLKGGGDPLGAFYDFIVDRIVIGAMLIGLEVFFVAEALWMEAVVTQVFFFLFFLKDVFDLKWKEAGVLPDNKVESDRTSGLFARLKIHFKPGQLLSCFLIFFIGPLSGQFIFFSVLAILCVFLSMVHNVMLPWRNYLKQASKDKV